MPKLSYFPLQGRAQAIRYLLGYKQVAFDDQHVSFEEWGAGKANGTNPAAQLPVWTEDDGSIKTQSKAILLYLANKHGVVPANADEDYEMNWFYETQIDFTTGKPEIRTAIG